MKFSNILGLNARTQLFAYKYNTRKGRNNADSKIQTARVLRKAGVAHPKIYKKFKRPEDVSGFDWSTLPDRFAIKPSRGLGGQGIIVVKKKLVSGGFLTTNKEKLTVEDLKLHTLDILEGAYSMGNIPDVAFIQEYVGRAKIFRKWAYRGTPDVRIIVFNKVPVMAMLRLPTKESGGRANLHQGAIGVGIDIATGITTKAIWHGDQIVFKPGTIRKLRGIKIPGWTTILETAVKAQMASGLGYLGVDVVIHPDKGPMVLELNAQPGLQIQLANMIPLNRRLDRVEDLDVADSDHGVMIAKAIFAGRFADRVRAEEGIKTISVWEEIKVVSGEGKKVSVKAKVDTGAWKTSVDKDMATKLDLEKKSNVLWVKEYKSSLGSEKRKVIGFTFYMAGRKIKTIANIANRTNLRSPVIIGRRDLEGFLIKTNRE